MLDVKMLSKKKIQVLIEIIDHSQFNGKDVDLIATIKSDLKQLLEDTIVDDVINN